jgi:folate-binding Fe-S cluster repair protein YgfZ
MDQLGGIDFTKGCYVGQEVVSRIEHRHIARRRAVTVTGAVLAAAGTDIIAGGKPIGTLASSINGTGIALVRLDRAKEALDKGETLTAAGSPVTITIPNWAKFGWPTTGIVEP